MSDIKFYFNGFNEKIVVNDNDRKIEINPYDYKSSTNIDWNKAFSTDDLNYKLDIIYRIHSAEVINFATKLNNKNRNVSSKYPLIFVHIPKNAGTSVCDALDIKKDSRGHGTLLDIKEEVGSSKFNKYKKVAIVRNPFDRFISWYFFTKDWVYNKNSNFNFESWFWNLDTHVHSVITTMWGKEAWTPTISYPCYNILLNEKQELDVDYLFRFEHLEEDWKQMFNDLNIEAPKLPKKNISKNKSNHYSSFYNCDSGEMIKQFIYDKFKNDFIHFGYKFEKKA